MIIIKVMLKYLYGILLVSMVMVMSLRSGLYVWRTLNEFVHPYPPFHPEITECSTELLGTQGQLRGLYNYRSLGKPCQKE
jgi:hypothetical protein